MEYGFVEFFDPKKDRMAEQIFKESINRDPLGLRKMNIRMSNLLFPFGSTLMPNLEYFYYLNAIYHNVVADKQKPTPDEIEKINDIEKKISEYLQSLAHGKGYYGERVDSSARGYERYKTNMWKMHYMEEDWKGAESESGGGLQSEKCLQEILKETMRYKAVKAFCEKWRKEDKEDLEFSEIIKEYPSEGENQWLSYLEPEECYDFICRVVQPYEHNITKWSLFANIVMHYLDYENNKGDFSDLEKVKEIGKEIRKKKSIVDFSFDKLGCFVSDSNKKNKELWQYENYHIAKRYSRLQYIAKAAYNLCLYSEGKKYDDYKKEIKKEIKNYYEKEIKEDGENFWSPYNKSGNLEEVFYGRTDDSKEDSDLKEAFAFINKIHQSIHKKGEAEEREKCINEIKYKVQERVRDLYGENAKINSASFDSINLFWDTFRWQYRPLALESDSKKSKSDSEKPQNNLCAQYYIYELFFE